MKNADIVELGFVTHRRQSRSQPENKVRDMQYADDIALL